jgi:acyl phosphate:glycerol-3-phosphate acyltransferase
MEITGVILTVAVAFLLGSVPTAFLIGKVRGIDVRQHGSGNVGATNIFRTIGTGYGTLVLALDILKGFVATFAVTRGGAVLIEALTSTVVPHESAFYNLMEVLSGAGAIAGHMWPPFLSWNGGKGVAAGAGVLLGIDPTVSGIAAGTFLVVFVALRYVSVGSLVGALASFVAAVALGRELPTVLLTLVALAFIGVRHGRNIARIRTKKEPRVRFPWEQKK